ncbi:MAG TPA: toprim domain-containing protein [Treponemataceae bacterium]|nr:toprim domain-containing protein [Treponemataceae bacterium]
MGEKVTDKRNSKKAEKYDESKIQTLSALEHIRLRTGMYIGRIGNGTNQNDGIYILLKEIVDNAVDEFIMGNGTQIDITIEDGKVLVRDFGRGIPLGKLVECVSIINTGAKYNDDVFQFSVGLNGVGTKAVNALSSYFRVVSIREGRAAEAIFERGILIKSIKNRKARDKTKNGTYVEFIPDNEIFDEYAFNMEFVERRIMNYAYLNTGLTLTLNGNKFQSENGLLDLLHHEVEDTALYPIGYYRSKKLEFSFTHSNGYGENYFSFVNGQYTSDGGTHLSAFKEGYLRGVNAYFNKGYKSEDVREGLTAAIAVKIQAPVFESQTKNKLGNTDVRSWILAKTRAAIEDWLHKHIDEAEALEKKIEANEKLRTELNTVKKEAKENARKISLKIPKLKDCKYHLGDAKAKGDETVIFITEGDSASGSMVGSRNAMTQAIFSLRGKCENMCGKKKTDIYKNAELYNLMMALGIENSIEGLRYSKVIIATDADNDGFHIRNLLLTFFLSFFEELVATGRVYILETPLFRVRNKKETVYCYSEIERDKEAKRLGRGVEMTRFKGLGEISPKEFGQFIGEDMRLVPIEIESLGKVTPLIDFYMGKNTPKRREFIMHNLLEEIGV